MMSLHNSRNPIKAETIIFAQLDASFLPLLDFMPPSPTPTSVVF